MDGGSMRSYARRLAAVAAALLIIVVVAIGGLALWVIGGPAAVLASELPTDGMPQTGVDYRAKVDCLERIRAGDLVYVLHVDAGWPPPDLDPGATVTADSIPGIVRFTSPTTGIFRAQTDGSEWPVGLASGPASTGFCI